MNQASRPEKRLQGHPLSEGSVVARACMFNEGRHNNLPMYKVDGAELEHQKERVRRAIRAASERLQKLQDEVAIRLGKAEAEIFVAQRMILEDEALQSEVDVLIQEEGANAEAAVTRVLDRYEARLQEVDDEYIKDRASDFGEAKRRLLDAMSNTQPELRCAGEEHCRRGRNRIVIAEELTPSLTVELDTQHLLGIVAERGGANSHGAILARALGIPAISGIPGVRNLIDCGTELFVDGTTGELVIWPEEETISRARTTRADGVRLPQPVDPVPGLRVMANLRIADDVQDALDMKAEGVGLYRTEIEVLAEGRLLTEEESYTRYLAVARAMNGHPVTYRLFDIGSDKPLPFLSFPPEQNPSLGWRGSRLLLERKDLFRAQARAMARVSQSVPVHVLYPMIVDEEQFVAVRDAFLEAVADLSPGTIYHGAMFEVPSACLRAGEILDEADFGSIGTNDLFQYLFAVDRNNELVAADFDPDHPAFWQVIRDLVAAAKARGKEMTVCGEMASDPRCVRKLMEAGIDTVSVNPRSVPVVRTAASRGGAGREGIDPRGICGSAGHVR